MTGRVSIVVPTYKEDGNIPTLVERVERALSGAGLTAGRDFDLWLMDDSPKNDPTAQVVAGLRKPWVHLVQRTGTRGLGYAVVEGLEMSKGDIQVVMDADLSHPPEQLPALIEAASAADCDFAIGSRYAPGGTIAGDWSLLRHLNSRAATLLARPFTRACDPMSGFIAFRRSLISNSSASLNPIGYKIGLEILVKCGCRKIREVPIHFEDRQVGSSKMGLKQQLQYLRQVRALGRFRFGEFARFAEFALVGASGTVVNLLTVTLAHETGLGVKGSVAVAILVSMTTNYLLNRSLTFRDMAKNGSTRALWHEYLWFVAVSTVGAAVNWWIASALAIRWEAMPLGLQLGALVGVLGGLAFNYFGSRFLVFGK